MRALTRRPDAVTPLRELGAEVVIGDMLDAASLDRACAGAGSVAASLLGRHAGCLLA